MAVYTHYWVLDTFMFYIYIFIISEYKLQVKMFCLKV
jgi:hypothetical protein